MIDTDPASRTYNTVISKIVLGEDTGPMWVTVNPDGTRAYVANYGSETVSVIDTDQASSTYNKVTATIYIRSGDGIDGPRWPTAVAVNPDGTRAYVTCYSGWVSVIDTDQASTSYNKVIATIDVGVFPYGVAVSPDGNRAYVPNQGANTMSVINTKTNRVIATFGRGDPAQIVVIPNFKAASSLATPGFGPGSDVDFSGPYGVALNADGTRAFVTNTGSNELLVIDTATYALIATVRVGSTPEGVAVNPGGTKVYVANNGNDTVSVIDI